MRRIGARLRKLLTDRRGSFLVEYSSFALLIAIAALALLTHMPLRPE
jgi:Flp pilus assembly pilin Flp